MEEGRTKKRSSAPYAEAYLAHEQFKYVISITLVSPWKQGNRTVDEGRKTKLSSAKYAEAYSSHEQVQIWYLYNIGISLGLFSGIIYTVSVINLEAR